VRRGRSTFGKIVGSYKGNVDQYYSEASALAETPACKNDVLPGSVDYPQCGQIDLDFGASPNLFRDSEGRLIVGVLQKSGVYHAAYTSNMKGAWTALVGAPCALCNASTSAYDGTKIYVAGTPGGQMLALNKDDGSIAWVSPEGDGAHYQPISTANGVVYSVSTRATLDSYDAELGVPVFSRPMPADTGDICEALSGGVAIARGRVYAPCDLGVSGGGWIVSYSYDAD
jgi:outer membrane protein assembly factor BamB